MTIRSSIALTTIPFAAVGRAADVDAMLSEAADRGRGGTWLDETIAAIRLAITPEALPVRVRFDPQLAASAVASFASRTALGAVDASVVRTTNGFAMTHAVQGSRVDEEAALAAVEGVLDDPSRTGGTEVAATVVAVAPELTNDGAANAILAARAMAADLAVAGSGSTWTLRASSIRGWISFGWLDGVYRPIVDRGVVAESLASIAKKVARPVRDAAFIRDRHGRIVGSMADRAGQVLDQPASADRIASAIEARITSPAPDAPPADDAVPLAVEAVAPTLSTAQAAAKAPLMVKLGSWTTHYQVAAHNGFGANITVPTRTLNGTVVQPGQVFDFWSALGEVSFRTGYRLGGAIVGGHSVEGKALAGGICAASTTLFNAALRSGFEILTRQPHWYYITRYPLGLDATVSGSQTMRFPKRHPVSAGDPRLRLAGHHPLRDLVRPLGADREPEPADRHQRGRRLRHDGQDRDAQGGDVDAHRVPGRRQGRLRDAHRSRLERPGDPPRDLHLALSPDGRDQPHRDRLGVRPLRLAVVHSGGGTMRRAPP